MKNQSLPLVSIITPSYNHDRFIRETIESVYTQDYPHVEHIIVDGGSTDGTLAILQQYRRLGDRLRYVSERDHGQSHAINKGLSMARGEIIGWLNSDDTYEPGAIRAAVNALQQRPDCGMVHGKCYAINEHSQKQSVLSVSPADYQKLFHGCVICQPAAFIRKNVFQQMGGVDESLQFCMDYDLWIRIAKHYPIAYVDQILANARLHHASKTSTLWNTVGISEVLMTVEKHYGDVSSTWMRHAPHYRRKAPAQSAQAAQPAGQPRPVSQTQPTGGAPVQQSIPATFGHPASIIGMNRYSDLWVPPLFRIQVQSDPSLPIHSLLIKGRSETTSSCNVLVNGIATGSYTASVPHFIWQIPLDPNRPLNQVDILGSQHRVDPGSNRLISYTADEVLPLTAQETALLSRSQAFFHRF